MNYYATLSLLIFLPIIILGLIAFYFRTQREQREWNEAVRKVNKFLNGGKND